WIQRDAATAECRGHQGHRRVQRADPFAPVAADVDRASSRRRGDFGQAMTVAEFARAFRAREITSEEATGRCLAAIGARNSELNAFTLVLSNDAIEQARQADREFAAGRDRGPLHGVPVSV